MTKPANLPIWDSTQLNTVVPDSNHQTYGWLEVGGVPEKPPFEYFNYWQNLVYLWLYEINARYVLDGINPLTGGGTLTAYQTNELQDSNTYTLPAANSVDANDTCTVVLPEKYKLQTPTVQRAGSDTISYSGGTDTAVIFNLNAPVELVFVSDGTSDWRI